MDWTDRKDAVITFTKRYRWAILILLAGLFLMNLPESTPAEEQPPADLVSNEEISFQEELACLLSKLEGAGEVRVLLSIESGSRTYYQSDLDQTQSSDSQSRRSETVIITESSRNEYGLVQKVDSPIYRGAVILCQGANNPGVKLAIVDAVSKATGLTSDKISVWKMK